MRKVAVVNQETVDLRDTEIAEAAGRVTATRVRSGWQEQAVCAGQDTSIWYDRGNHHHAIALCTSCPVRWPCLAEAVREEQAATRHDAHGVRGAFDATARTRIANKLSETKREKHPEGLVTPEPVPDTKQQKPNIDISEVENLANEGLDRHAIAARIGCSWKSIYSACRRHRRRDIWATIQVNEATHD